MRSTLVKWMIRVELGSVLPIASLLWLATGCASIMDGKTQAVVFNSTPDGAEVIFNVTKLGVTPFTSILDRKEADKMIVVVRKDGYEDQTIQLTTKMNNWFWGNILAGGVIGSTTDFVSGNYSEYAPDKYFVTLVPKKASTREIESLERQMWARHFMLKEYANIMQDLAMERGEYLSSVFKILGYGGEEPQDRLWELRELSAKHSDVVTFAEAIVSRMPL